MNPDIAMKIIISLIVTVCMLFVLMLVVGTTTDISSQYKDNEANDTSNNENKKVDIANLFFIISGILGIGSGLTILAIFYYTYVK